MFKTLKSKFIYDPLFKILLESEFWPELRNIIKLKFITPNELEENSGEEAGVYDFLLDFFKKKYQSDGRYPSELFDKVSNNLKGEYLVIHNTICSLLYSKLDKNSMSL